MMMTFSASWEYPGLSFATCLPSMIGGADFEEVVRRNDGLDGTKASCQFRIPCLMRSQLRAVGPCEPASTCYRQSFREPIPYLGGIVAVPCGWDL